MPDALLSVVFPRSGARSYAAALAVASVASRRLDVVAGRQVAHFAEFSRSPSQAAAAVALLGYVAAWSGVAVFSLGRPVAAAFGVRENLARVLSCYLEASACRSVAAHCVAPVGGGLVPCRHVLRVFPVPLERGHPASFADQIQAKSVAAGCDFCPLFDARRAEPRDTPRGHARLSSK